MDVLVFNLARSPVGVNPVATTVTLFRPLFMAREADIEDTS